MIAKDCRQKSLMRRERTREDLGIFRVKHCGSAMSACGVVPCQLGVDLLEWMGIVCVYCENEYHPLFVIWCYVTWGSRGEERREVWQKPGRIWWPLHAFFSHSTNPLHLNAKYTFEYGGCWLYLFTFEGCICGGIVIQLRECCSVDPFNLF